MFNSYVSHYQLAFASKPWLYRWVLNPLSSFCTARRDIPRGDAILEDQPLLTIPCEEMEHLTLGVGQGLLQCGPPQ